MKYEIKREETESEVMDWIERNNCDVCVVDDTGLPGEEYMELSNGYTWYAANGEWAKGKFSGAESISKDGISCEEVTSKMEDI